MSFSSSTIRISSAIRPPFQAKFSFRRLGCTPTRQRVASKPQADQRPSVRNAGEVHLAGVFLDDLVDDGEPQPGALLACRNVWFDNALPVLRETDAVVGDLDLDFV